MQIFKKLVKFALLGLIAVIFAACLIAVFLLMLAALEYGARNLLSMFGFELKISDEIARTVLTLGGALSVGCLALFGVHRQNLSAERRHKVDSSLTLRKEILLQVAEAASTQYQFLLSFASPDITEVERKAMTEKIGAAFFRLQVVGRQETIDAMLQANEAWTRSMFAIRALGPTPERLNERMDRLIEIQRLAKPFMEKHWLYNTIARQEIESNFADEKKYRLDMSAQYSKISALIEDIKRSNFQEQ